MKTVYEYDSVGNIVRQATTGSASVELEYSYDRNGQLLRERRTEGEETATSRYSYDALGRIAGYATDRDGGRSERYSYDAAGNMVEKRVNDLPIRMTYNAANQLMEMASAKGVIAYSYSPNGDLTGKVLDGAHKDSYAYDVAGNLTQYAGYDGYTVNYRYSALNMLMEKTATSNTSRTTLEEIVSGEGKISRGESSTETVTTQYTYDILQTYYNVLAETTNGETTQYEYGLERIAAYTATDAESVKTQYVYDVRGSVIQTVSSGVMDHISETTTTPQIQSYAYTPFGEQQGDKVSGYTYNAEYYDSATGMLNLRARQYEPAMMRFAQPDIVRGYAFNAQTLNRYSYSLNNPITYSDPSGMIIKQVLGGLAGAIAGAKSGAKTAYGASKKTGANTLQSIVTGVKGAIAGAKVGYKAGSSAGKKASNVRSAITKGKAAGSKAGAVAGLRAAVNQAQKRKGSMTPKQLSALAQQQELLRKARNAVGAEYESILREIDRACSAYSGIAQAKDTPTEAATVHDVVGNEAFDIVSKYMFPGDALPRVYDFPLDKEERKKQIGEYARQVMVENAREALAAEQEIMKRNPSLLIQIAETLEWFRNRVDHAEEWDYKRYSQKVKWHQDEPFSLNGIDVGLHEFGNVNYGYVGCVMGLSKDILIAGSVYAHFTELEWYHFRTVAEHTKM